jgi:hypothetical protein
VAADRQSAARGGGIDETIVRRLAHLHDEVDDIGQIIGVGGAAGRQPRVDNIIRRRCAVGRSGGSLAVIFRLLLDVLGHFSYREQNAR